MNKHRSAEFKDARPGDTYSLLVKGFGVYVAVTDEGVVVDIQDGEGGETLASTYAFDNEREAA